MPYTVASTLQDILARKKAEATQAAREALTTRQVNSQIENQTENTASLKMEREAQAANTAAQEEQRRVANMSGRGYQIGTQPDLSPEDAAFAKSHGFLSDTNPVSGPPEANPDGSAPTKMGGYWLGSKADQDQLSTSADIDQMFSGLDPEDPNTKRLSLQLPLLKLAVSQGKIAPAELTTMMKPDPNDQQGYIYDEQLGKFNPAVDPRTGKPIPHGQITAIPRPAVGPAPKGFQFAGTDPVTHLPISMDLGSGSFRISPIAGQAPPSPPDPNQAGQGMGPKPVEHANPNGGKVPPIIDETLFRTWLAVQNDPTAKEETKNQILLEAQKKNPRVISLVRKMVDQGQGLPFDQLSQYITPTDSKTGKTVDILPDDLDSARFLYGVFTGAK